MTRQGNSKNFSTTSRGLRRAAIKATDAADNYVQALGKLGGDVRPQDGMVLYIDPEDHESKKFEGEYMCCEVCGMPLNRLTGVDGEESWLHSRAWREYDHEPVPKPADRKLVDQAVCDFCGTETRMYWAFVGNRVKMGAGNTVHDYGTTWSGCQTCSQHIIDSDVDALLTHAMRVSPAMQGLSKRRREATTGGWLSLWGQFLPSIRERSYLGPQVEPGKLTARMMPKIQHGMVKFWKNPLMREQVNHQRRTQNITHHLPGVHYGDENQFAISRPPEQPISEHVWLNHVEHLVAGLWTSDLYWISRDFTRLATMAGKDFDKLLISREELPSPFGIMVFEEPIGEIERKFGNAGIRAVSWSLVPGGVWVNLYIQVDDAADPEEDPVSLRHQFGYLVSPNPGSGLTFNHDHSIPEGEHFQFLTTIFATWFLMNQPGVAEQNKAPVDKKLERAYRRENNRPLPDVQLVDLRRRPRRSGSDAEREGRPLKYRVYRKGHWKRQFYGPGRALRKTIYVSGYIAGPEGTPLHEKPRVVKVLR